MNSLQITALVCVALVLLFGGLMGTAWIYHCVMHRGPRPPRRKRTLQENLDALGRAQWFQFFITIGFGLFGAFVLYCFFSPGLR